MKTLIEPALRDDAFLADVAASRDDLNGFRLWWLGQSGFLVQWLRRHLLLDPYLSDSLTHKYAGTDKPHVRMTRRVIPPERLDFINVVTSSHNHTDHLDADTIIPLLDANPKGWWYTSPNLQIIIPEANRQFVRDRLKLGTSSGHLHEVHGLDDGTSVQAAGVSFTGVAAAHENLDRDESGRHLYLGYIVRLGDWTLYHSGDTVLYEGMADRLYPYGIDVALLPINGRAPERRVAGNLWGREAARLAKEIGAKLVIPCHYDMFEFNTATPDEFVAECERIGQPYRVLRQGERFSSSELREEIHRRDAEE